MARTSGSPAPTVTRPTRSAQLEEFALRHALGDGETTNRFTVARQRGPQTFIRHRWNERFGADAREAAANASTTATSGYPPLRLARISTIGAGRSRLRNYQLQHHWHAARQQEPQQSQSSASEPARTNCMITITGKPLCTDSGRVPARQPIKASSKHPPPQKR